jgi:hypothetical protein
LILKQAKHILPLIAFLLLLASLSCKRNCDFVPVSSAGVRFYTISGTRQEVTKNFDSIYVYPLNLEDSILYDWARNVNSIRLPLSPFEDFSSFVFKLNDVTDTLQIYYKRQLYFVSEECGFSVNFYLDSILFTPNQIDSAIIIQPIVQAINEEHIRLYF